MFSGAPAARRKELLADRHRLCLERRAHGVVPAIEKAEGGERGDDRKIERDALAFGKERASTELPHGGELLLVDAEMQRALGGVRHAVLAAGGTARDVRDEALDAAVDLALRIPDRAE